MATNSPSPTKPGLWPIEIPRHTESVAEQKVYKVLKTSFPKGWYAWHSLRLRTREKGEFSEADFIIADPNRPGIFILEVKGGQIEQRDGQWYQNSQPLKASPLGQAFSFRKKLIRRFWENACPLLRTQWNHLSHPGDRFSFPVPVHYSIIGISMIL